MTSLTHNVSAVMSVSIVETARKVQLSRFLGEHVVIEQIDAASYALVVIVL